MFEVCVDNRLVSLRMCESSIFKNVRVLHAWKIVVLLDATLLLEHFETSYFLCCMYMVTVQTNTCFGYNL